MSSGGRRGAFLQPGGAWVRTRGRVGAKYRLCPDGHLEGGFEEKCSVRVDSLKLFSRRYEGFSCWRFCFFNNR